VQCDLKAKTGPKASLFSSELQTFANPKQTALYIKGELAL